MPTCAVIRLSSASVSNEWQPKLKAFSISTTGRHDEIKFCVSPAGRDFEHFVGIAALIAPQILRHTRRVHGVFRARRRIPSNRKLDSEPFYPRRQEISEITFRRALQLLVQLHATINIIYSDGDSSCHYYSRDLWGGYRQKKI